MKPLASSPLTSGRSWAEEYGDAVGSYLLFFKDYCIDATSESGRLGRLLNHYKTHPNPKAWQVIDLPKVILVALHDIPAGTQLRWDYGERDKCLTSMDWLKH